VSIDVKKLLYKYPKLLVAQNNIVNSINRLSKQYPSCTPRYSDDIQGRGGLPHSQTEALAFFNVVDIAEKRQELEWDHEEYNYVINLIRSAMDTLNGRQKELIELWYFKDKEPASVANDMGVSLSRLYHMHSIALTGVEQCLNSGNIFLNRLIPTKSNKNSNKKTTNQTVKTAV
jgi:DNA-directed RNA polymerase specialized sigma24 family protein